MSDSATETATEHVAVTAPEQLFTKDDLNEFVSEDVAAGRIICKMLSILFIYTIVAMSIVSYWTSVQD